MSPDTMIYDEQIHSEFVDEETGQFVTIYKIKMKHLMVAAEHKKSMRQLVSIYHQVVRIDGESLTESEWMEKDWSECDAIVDKVNEQIG